MTDAVCHKERAPVAGEVKHPLELQARHPLFARAEQIPSDEPFAQQDMRIFKNRIDRHGELATAILAAIKSAANFLFRVRRDNRNAFLVFFMRFLNVFVAFLLATAGCKKVGGSGPPPGMATQVVAVKAERSAVADTLPLVGTIRANESVDIKSQVGGMVEKIHFEEGQRVTEGAPLIDIDANKLAASLAQSEANCRLAQSKFDRARDLSQTRAVSQQELDEARATFDASSANVDLYRQQMKDTKILAPFSGVVGARMISPGR